MKAVDWPAGHNRGDCPIQAPALREQPSACGLSPADYGGPIRPPLLRSNPTAGFTLLEMIVATALMGIAVIGLMSLISQSTAAAARVAQYDRASMLARSQMNELLTMKPLPVGQPLSGAYDDDSGWEAKIEPYQTPQTEVFGQSVLARIDLTIWWRADGRRKQFQLEGFTRTRRTRDMDLAPAPAPTVTRSTF